MIPSNLISEAIADRKRFRKGEPTKEEMIDYFMWQIPNPQPITLDNGDVVRKLGCSAIGGCGCTGACQELIPFSALDQFDHDYYNERMKLITDALDLYYD